MNAHHQGWRWLGVTLLLAALVLSGAKASHEAAPDVIHAKGDAALLALAAAQHWAGAGTAQDPLRIADLAFGPMGKTAVTLEGTRLHVLIVNVSVSGDRVQHGFRLVDAQNVTIERASIESTLIGIHVEQSRAVTISNTSVKTSGTGIAFAYSHGNVLQDTRLAVNDRDVSFLLSQDNVLRRNNLSIATGQTAVHFFDTFSFANDADATNVVNDMPLRWITRGGTVDEPLRLSDVRVELRGITNLAQVIVHGAPHVVLENVTAKDGAGDGIAIRASSNVTVANVTVEANRGAGLDLGGVSDVVVSGVTARENVGDGIEMEDVWRARVANATMQNNGGDGVRLSRGGDVDLSAVRAAGNARSGISLSAVGGVSAERVVVERNSQHGVRFDQAPDLTLVGAWSSGNGADGIRVERSDGASISASRVVTNGGAGIRVEGTVGVNLTRNHVEGNHAAGIHLQSSRDGLLSRNEVRGGPIAVRLASSSNNTLANQVLEPRPGGTGLHFDDESSYDNAVATSNLFHGTPVHWYARLNWTAAGEPVVLDGIRAETRGVTNVAQVGIVHSSGVRIESGVMANGTARGLLVTGSDDVALVASAVRHNDGDGVRVERSDGFSMEKTIVQRNAGNGVVLAQADDARLAHNGVLLNGRHGIDASGSAGVSLANITANDNGGVGIRIANARGDAGSGAQVVNATLRRNQGGGAHVESANLARFETSTLSQNHGFGLRLTQLDAPAEIRNNTFQNHTASVELLGTTRALFHDNAIAAKPGQVGFHFDGRASYENTIGPDNLHNGVPLRWYVAPRGTVDEPLRIGGFSVAANATNVAQLMVYRGENVLIEDVVASRGRDSGVLVLASANVTLRTVTAEQNGGVGIRLDETTNVTIAGVGASRNSGAGMLFDRSDVLHAHNSTFRANGGDGAHLLRVNATLADIDASNNGGSGVRLAGPGAILPSLARVNASGNAHSGVHVSDAQAGVVEEVVASGNGHSGARFERIIGGSVLRLRAEHNGDAGILLEATSIERVEDGMFAHSPEGLRVVRQQAPVQVLGNAFEHHARAVKLERSSGGLYDDNAIMALARQTGFHFVDVESYANTLTPNNTVNGHALQWYTNVTNATIRGARAELPGMTNVAQVMIHASSNVTVERPVANDGLDDGLVVFASERIRVVEPAASGNRGYGIVLVGGSNHTVSDGASTSNRAGGVMLRAPAALDGTNVSDNRGAGIRLEAEGSSVTEAHVERNSGGGVIVAAGLTRVADSTINDNGESGVRLQRAGAGVHVERNRIEGHPHGIHIDATELAEIHHNEITIADGGFGIWFVDPGAYNNRITETNSVNGVPVRWYTALTGTEDKPVRLEGIRVELRGITNVAQVMVYRSAYVTMPDVVASNGVARGVHVHRSSSIELQGATASNNAGPGVHLESSRSSRVLDTSVRGNAIGVKLDDSHNNLLRGIDASQVATGVLVDRLSTANRIFGISAGDARDASVSDPSVRGTRGNNIVVDAGRDARIGVGGSVSLTGGLVSSRFESERVVSQSWDFGDGARSERAGQTSYQPTHTYASSGTFVVTLRAQMADGAMYADTMTVRVIGPMTAPTSVRAVQGAGAVSVTWAAPASDGGTDVTSYRVYRGESPETGSFVAEVGASSFSLLDTADVRDDLARHYAVAAVAGGREGPRSAWTQAVSGAEPTAPMAFSAEAGASRVTLTWQPPADAGGLPISAYVLLRATAGGEPTAHVELGNLMQHVDLDVVDGTTYVYQVQAVNSLGVSPPSPPDEAMPVRLPEAPASLAALPGERRMTLVWTPPAEHPAAPILHYRVWRGEPAGDAVLIAQTSMTWHRDVGLSHAEDYAYAVSAVTLAGEGPRTQMVRAAAGPVDDTAPIVVGIEPANGTTTSKVRPIIIGDFVDGGGQATAVLRFDGQEVARVSGDVTQIQWQPPEGVSYGDHVIVLNVSDAVGFSAERASTFRLLTADEERPRLEWSNLTLPGTEMALGETMTVTAQVSNVGYVPAALDAQAKLDAEILVTHPFALAPGETTNLTFAVKPERAGAFQLTIGGFEPQALTVISLDEDEPPATDAPPAASDVPPPDEEARGFLGIPGPGIPLAIAMFAAVAVGFRARRPS